MVTESEDETDKKAGALKICDKDLSPFGFTYDNRYRTLLKENEALREENLNLKLLLQKEQVHTHII
jgi:hypothetical protein